MAQSDPEPEAASATEPAPATEATSATEAAEETEAEKELGAEKNGSREDGGDEKDGEDTADEEGEPKPDPDTARRTVDRLLWTSAWLTVMVAVFLVVGILQADADFGGLAWLGAVVAILGLLALAAAYGACAMKRLTLRTHLGGPFDVFKAGTVVMIVVAICGLLVPIDNKPALAVLLPWAVTYWLYGLDTTESPTT